MPPTIGHFRQNPPNTFQPFPPAHHQASHFQHQTTNFPTHNIGNHPTFPSAVPHQNGHSNIFAPSLTNSAIASNFATAGALGSAGGTGLASHEAQMRFAHGAALQQQAAEAGASLTNQRGAGMPTRIREVWSNNLAQEMSTIRTLVDRYPFVSMDTEFPGIVARPIGNFPSKADYHYQCLRCNVDLLKLIQLGITLFAIDGGLPPASGEMPLNRNGFANNLMVCPTTWSFNFKFSLEEDMYSEDSIAMLKKAGVDFEKNAELGIDPEEFGSLLTTSGLVLDENISWLSFHSGYDFGYLIKIMTCKQLPNDEEEYLSLVRAWFPRLHDIKYLFRHAQRLAQRGVLTQQAQSVINAIGQRSGLQDIADELGCIREGRPHTAGSDAWLTGLVFWQLRHKMFDGQIPEDLVGMIWGLSGVGPPASSATQAAIMAGHQTPNTNGATLYHTGMTPTAYKPNAPATPQTSHSGLSSTPNPHNNHGYPSTSQGMGTGGAFANFQYGGR